MLVIPKYSYIRVIFAYIFARIWRRQNSRKQIPVGTKEEFAICAKRQLFLNLSSRFGGKIGKKFFHLFTEYHSTIILGH